MYVERMLLSLQPCTVVIREISNIDVKISNNSFGTNLKQRTMPSFETTWTNSISGRGRNKLRTYRLFKQTYDVEKYCLLNLPPCHRSAFCKFRCGDAPIRIETGRYENMAEEDRKCPFCKTIIEDEAHVILDCPMYTDFRSDLLLKASGVYNNFMNFSKLDQSKVLFTHPSLIRIHVCAKTCFNILKRRTQLLCK